MDGGARAEAVACDRAAPVEPLPAAGEPRRARRDADLELDERLQPARQVVGVDVIDGVRALWAADEQLERPLLRLWLRRQCGHATTTGGRVGARGMGMNAEECVVVARASLASREAGRDTSENTLDEQLSQGSINERLHTGT